MNKLYLLFLLSVLTLSGCAPRDNYLKKLADEGTINNHGTLINTVSVEIESSDKYIWDILVDIPRWPNWNPDIPEVIANGVTYKGDNFAWKWERKVYSSVHYFEEGKKIVLVSKSMAYSSIMKWELEALTKNRTRVTLSESRDGFFMNFLSANKHKLLLKSFLDNLKNRSEVVFFK